MNKVRKFLLNKGSSIAYAIIMALFTVIPVDFFKLGIFVCNWSEPIIIIVNRSIYSLIIFVIVNIIYHAYLKKRTSVEISDRMYSIIIEYADLFEIKKGIKVINFDECFTTTIGDKPEDIKRESICGQYLTKYPINDMQELIQKSGIKPDGKSKYAQKEKYKIGTIIPKDDFMLMSFSKLDENGLGRLTYSEYLECLNNLWEQIDMYRGTSDVYLPILGSGTTRSDKELTQQELLDIIIYSYKLTSKKIKEPNKLHIVCKKRKDFSLNSISGID